MVRLSLFAGVVAAWLVVLHAGASGAERRQLDAETLRAGLRTTTIEENGFIDRVLALVDKGRLPAGVVYRVFLWARQKPKNKFQYFRRAMIILAARRGIRL
ncbi:MAG TPA: hypothetical protein EYP56_19200 [Planctomycetaceae bacterium]|nr:hypothetical protein [Planctomycetaceae bacterium]